MKQKADHHLEFLADKNDRANNLLLPLLPGLSEHARPFASTSSAHLPLQPSPLGVTSQLPAGGDDDDAAGESDDAAEHLEPALQSFRTEDERPVLAKTGPEEQASRKNTPSKSTLIESRN